MTISAAIVAAEAIRDLLNAVFGSSPFSPKYSINGKLSIGQSTMAIFNMFQPVVKVSLLRLNFPYTPLYL